MVEGRVDGEVTGRLSTCAPPAKLCQLPRPRIHGHSTNLAVLLDALGTEVQHIELTPPHEGGGREGGREGEGERGGEEATKYTNWNNGDREGTNFVCMYWEQQADEHIEYNNTPLGGNEETPGSQSHRAV